MLETVKSFLKSEEGDLFQKLVGALILGLGTAGIYFGLFSSARFLSSGVGDDLKEMVIPSSLPTATEQITQINAGYTGAITSIEIQ